MFCKTPAAATRMSVYTLRCCCCCCCCSSLNDTATPPPPPFLPALRPSASSPSLLPPSPTALPVSSSSWCRPTVAMIAKSVLKNVSWRAASEKGEGDEGPLVPTEGASAARGASPLAASQHSHRQASKSRDATCNKLSIRSSSGAAVGDSRKSRLPPPPPLPATALKRRLPSSSAKQRRARRLVTAEMIKSGESKPNDGSWGDDEDGCDGKRENGCENSPSTTRPHAGPTEAVRSPRRARPAAAHSK